MTIPRFAAIEGRRLLMAKSTPGNAGAVLLVDRKKIVVSWAPVPLWSVQRTTRWRLSSSDRL